jgi:exosortase
MAVEPMNGFAEKTPSSAPVEKPALPTVQVILFAAGFVPLLAAFFVNLWQRPHYQFFPLALGGAAFLAWTRVRELPRPLDPGRPRTGKILWILSLALLMIATVLWSPWIGSLAALSGLIAGIWTVGGRQLLRTTTPALILLAAIIPPPLSLDTRLADSLRVLAVNWSSHLLDILGVTHYRSGNVIEMRGKTLLVEEACSGINSLLITMAACLFYMLWRRRSLISTLLALAGSLSFVVLGNLVRITLGAWLLFHRNIDILSGWPHQTIGLFMFAGYMLLIFSLERFLFFLTRPSRQQRRRHDKSSPPAEPARQSRGLNPQWVRFAAFAFAFLGVVAIGRGWTHEHAQRNTTTPKSALSEGATFTLPGQIGEWTRIASASPLLQKIETLGVYSKVWHFQRRDLVASIALDYPFAGYHDVTVCYTMQGWKVLERHSSEVKDSKGTVPCAEVQMEDDLGLRGSLWFSTVNEQGQWVEIPVSERAFVDRWRISGRVEPTTYRLQVLVTTFAPLPAAEQAQVRQLFENARVQVWNQLRAQLKVHP